MAERDLDQALQRMGGARMSRRGFLYLAGLSSAAAALAACAGSSASPSTAASVAPSAAAPSVGGGASVAPSLSAAPTAAPSYEIEKQLYMYNWAEYISPKNIDEFKKRYGVTKFTYDVYDNNEALLAKLQAGGGGYDIAAPTAEYVPGMVEEGYLQKLDLSRLPNTQYINATFKGVWWDPTNEYQVPKDYGTTGILYMKSKL